MKKLRNLDAVSSDMDGEVIAEEWADESEDTKKDAPVATETSGTAKAPEGVSNGGTPVFDPDYGHQIGVRPDEPIIIGQDVSPDPITPPVIVPDPELLEVVVKFVRRYVVLTDAQADAIALWVTHTYAFSAADTTPYVAVTSAEKRSGKTRLLEVLELLVREPLPTANISAQPCSELSPS
jgi:hypothetical protein